MMMMAQPSRRMVAVSLKMARTMKSRTRAATPMMMIWVISSGVSPRVLMSSVMFDYRLVVWELV